MVYEFHSAIFVDVLERFHLLGILQSGKTACNKKTRPLSIKVKPILPANSI